MRRLVTWSLIGLFGVAGMAGVGDLPHADASPTSFVLRLSPRSAAARVAVVELGEKVQVTAAPKPSTVRPELGVGTDDAKESLKVASTTNTYSKASGPAPRWVPPVQKEVLARAIHSEARGEPYVGQVAVGAVILNRTEHPKFPNSIAGVVYQRGAFTAVADGQINLRPNATAYKAAEDALAGWDPTGGAIYYYNPAKTTNKWIWSRPVVVRYGQHLFAR